MSVTLRFTGPPSPGYADDGETWHDDLGHELGYPFDVGLRVRAGEALTLDGDGWSIVKQDPDDPAAYAPDAILLDTPYGQRVALPRSRWSADGEPADTVDDVLARVGDDPQRAAAELAAELAKGDAARKTLVAKLEAIAAPAEQPPADTTGGE